ncbi:MAG: PBP1A family penicillin-binding protein [Deltaproteobacteria bacterium]|nr:PBP1A family penicillin-binding protein [Deltaproteobacteria bacterium]
MANRGSRKGGAQENRTSVNRGPHVRSPVPNRLQPMKTLGATARLIRRLGWRRTLFGIFMLATFSCGFYLANLYNNISQLIAQRRAALTSAIYSAPLEITAGDEIGPLHLIDRLERLSYSRVQQPSHPGEYSMEPGTMAIYVREFRVGDRNYPAALLHLSFDGERVAGIADSFGIAQPQAMLEPEIIGRLLPDAPAERVEVSLSDVPPYLIKGLLATEDRFFYYHFGFDPVRIVEAAIIDLHSHRLSQGASTLTQQLARTFIEQHTRSFHRKFRELAIALVLEMRLSKNEILERYINDVWMGEYQGTPIYGMPLAARYFFNKDLRQVTPAEAAALIGMIQAPSSDDPRRHPDAARQRRNTVLGLMRQAGALDQTRYEAALAEPVVTVPPPGLRRAPYFTDYVTAQVSKLPAVSGMLAGLRVYTTLDPELEESGHQAMLANLEHLEKLHPHLRRRAPGKRLESALVAIEPRSGAILAMVGGRDYSVSQFNRVASAERQPGSAFKPIVYLTALDPALSPLAQPVTLASILPDRPMSFGGWTPANYEGTYVGDVTVAEALADSLNVPTAYLGSLLGPPAMIRTAHLMGIQEDLPNYLPISIGAGEVTLLEMAAVYGVFANGGVMRAPYAIEAVVDSHGRVIYQHSPRPQRLMSRAVAYLMTGALRGVLQYGTGKNAVRMGLDFPAAGKTGTTEDYRDAYFIGYTRQLVCGVWVGFDQPQDIGLPGADAALPAWVDFMRDAVRQPQIGFGAPPPGITMATIDPTTGGLATPSCPRVATLPFLSGTEPTQSCRRHSRIFAASTPLSPNPSTEPPSNSGALQPLPAPAAATNNVLGTIGNFFSGLFGHH